MACSACSQKVWLDLCEKLALRLHRISETGSHIGQRRHPIRETVTTHCEVCHQRWGLSLSSLHRLRPE